MTSSTVELSAFLMRAKAAAYAGEGAHASSSRTASIDIPYQEGRYSYLDTYLGGLKFIGEEAVWKDEKPIWGMNYYGWMIATEVPAGFSEFLKSALRQIPPDAPYRGPENYANETFSYHCKWQGTLERFNGREVIYLSRHKIYELVFHGGKIH